MQRLIILFGSSASERRVSVASAQHIASLLPDAMLWFWAPDGAVHEVDPQRLLSFARPFELDFDPGTAATFPTVAAALDSATPADTFVLALHGVGGEDGTVQTWLEARRLCFTGSSAAASRKAFDKAVAKNLVQARGGRTAFAHTIRGAQMAAARAVTLELLQHAGRAVLKPLADGSSTGLRFIDDVDAVDDALFQLRTTPEAPYLIEEFIAGTELTVGVVDTDHGLRALPCSEIRAEAGRKFDYVGKYLGVGIREITPAEVPPKTHAQAGALALLAHQAMGCSGYSRTDIIASASGLVFIEINNLPGLTRASFIPQQLAAAGISMHDFLRRQIHLARARYST